MCMFLVEDEEVCLDVLFIYTALYGSVLCMFFVEEIEVYLDALYIL